MILLLVPEIKPVWDVRYRSVHYIDDTGEEKVSPSVLPEKSTQEWAGQYG